MIIRTFFSDPERIHLESVHNINTPYIATPWWLLATVEAAGNMRLAVAERTADARACASKAASPLARELSDIGACHDGLSVVGADCDYDKLDVVFAYRPEWLRWYETALDELARDAEDRGDYL